MRLKVDTLMNAISEVWDWLQNSIQGIAHGHGSGVLEAATVLLICLVILGCACALRHSVRVAGVGLTVRGKRQRL